MATTEQFAGVAFYEDESHDLVTESGTPILLGTPLVHPEEMEFLGKVLNVYRVNKKGIKRELKQLVQKLDE